MKKLIAILVVVIFATSLWAQAPKKMSYQAVIRDNNDNLVANQQIGLQIRILQGSVYGASVFVEVHTPTTNENGLASLMIGEGNVVYGGFDDIDWSNEEYFLEVQIDLTGGDNYAITTTSQFLSVPYAYHAKTAENVTGVVEVVETDPIFAESQAAKITEGHILNFAKLQDITGINTGDQDLSEYAMKTSVLTLNNTQEFIPNEDYEPATKKYVDENAVQYHIYKVGDFSHGGIVFWVDESGQHGLVCKKEDESENAVYWSEVAEATGAKGDGLYSGAMNSMLMTLYENNAPNEYPAGLCVGSSEVYGSLVYGGWYLPSKFELNLIYQNRLTINATSVANSGRVLSTDYYWTSTELDTDNAWVQDFSSFGGQLYWDKVASPSPARVRAIRRF